MPTPRPAGDAVTEDAPAKLNLFLHIVGRRDDGYHLLDTMIAFASVADRVEVAADDRLSLTIDGPFADALPAPGAPAHADNLVLRAARGLADLAGRPAVARIRLTKRLPVAAGIGGGSADAAATLRALSRLWHLDPNAPRIRALALQLGADVPMCLVGGTSFAGGIGEHLTPAPPLTGTAVALVNPGVPLSTPDVFRARRPGYAEPGRFDGRPADRAVLLRCLRERRNDLTEPATRLCPEVGAVLQRLESLEGCTLARMSGSGATCFALFESQEQADAAARTLATERPGWWVAAGSLL